MSTARIIILGHIMGHSLDVVALPFAIRTQVRIRSRRLSVLSPAEVRRLKGRIGTVTGYRMGAVAPIVVFPRLGRFPELKLYEVPPTHLEVVARTGEAK